MITLKNMEKTQTKSKITKNYVKIKTLLNVEFLSYYLLEYEFFFCINFTRKIEKYFKMKFINLFIKYFLNIDLLKIFFLYFL